MSAAWVLPPLGATRLSEPHHDGSDAYVVERPDELGEAAVVRLRVPREFPVETVALRYVRDGEPRAVRAALDAETETETWWRATFPVANPATRYRWLVGGSEIGYSWLNGLGMIGHDVPDDDDFVVTVGGGGPAWHLESVVYEVFPDRFSSSGAPVEPPEWAVPRPWGERPTGRGLETPFEWFGGDLAGIEERLDHVESLGASVLYLTPFFPAGSTHRYDATSFDRVDPLLGGDAALSSLVAAAHARSMRVIGDLTLNHTGESHDWFRAAREDSSASERSFYLFDDAGEYESWLGISSLPKLDHRSPALADRLDQVVQRWLRPPFDLDGWRIDVANMAGRHRDVDVTHELARRMRRSLALVKTDALLLAEHNHDARGDLLGDGWHGTMNYPGFTRPTWSWLRAPKLEGELSHDFLGLPTSVPMLAGTEVVATMRAFRAGVPWHSALHSWALLGSHDTARFRTVAGSAQRHGIGLGLQMTTPGVPMVFAGDEIGLEGDWGEDARRTMPWERPGSWDRVLLEQYRRLIALRRSSPALARGGIRYAFVDADVIAYLRESEDERLLCLASRGPHESVRLPLAALGCSELEPLLGGEPEYAGDDVIVPAEGPAFHVWRLT